MREHAVYAPRLFPLPCKEKEYLLPYQVELGARPVPRMGNAHPEHFPDLGRAGCEADDLVPEEHGLFDTPGHSNATAEVEMDEEG